MPGSLKEQLVKDPWDFNFYWATLVMESHVKDGFPEVEDPFARHIKFVPDNSLAFPASDILKIYRMESGYRMVLSFMGLYGVSSPLPSYFIDGITFNKEHARPLKGLLEIFSHRIYTLYYKAWKKNQSMFAALLGNEDKITSGFKLLSSQSIASVKSTSKKNCLEAVAGGRLFGAAVRSAENLAHLLEQVFQLPKVEVQQWRGQWIQNPAPSVLDGTVALGKGCFLGKYCFDVLGFFKVKIGPMEFSLFQKFFQKGVDGTTLGEKTKEFIKSFLRDPLDFDVELELQIPEGEKCELGGNFAQIGRGAWLGSKPSEALLVRA